MFRPILPLALAVILPFTASAQQKLYSVTQLPSNFVPSALNNAGQIVGYATIPNVGGQAALWSNGKLTMLGTLTGGTVSQANAINSLGQIVGESTRGDGSTHAFLYDQGKMTDLGVLSGGGYSSASGINDAGFICGTSQVYQPNTYYNLPEHAFVYSGGKMADIGNLGGSFTNPSHASGVNNKGQVVGWSNTDSGETHVILYANSKMTDLGTLGSFFARGTGINDNGDICGYGSDPSSGYQHLFIIPAGGKITDLGVLAGNNNAYGVSINNDRQIVGNSSPANGKPAILYSPGTGIVDLQTLVDPAQANPYYAPSINGSGQIVSITLDANNAPSGSYLLTPPRLKLANISTRLRVLPGDNASIAGFIITGTDAKNVIVRGLGPSVPVSNNLADPTLELRDSSSSLAINNDWKDTQQAAIEATGVAPKNDLESAIVRSLPANSASYTAILRGNNNSSGIGLVEVYDLAMTANSQLANISTRGFVDVNDNAMIGGFIVSGNATYARVLIRALGPSVPVSGSLPDPTLQLVDGNGTTLANNDNWQDTQANEIAATGIPPSNNAEAATVQTLRSGAYTAIVRGKNNATGIALVEIYNLP